MSFLEKQSAVKFSKNEDNQFETGYCAFEVDPGNWTCYFNGPINEDDFIAQKFIVRKHKTEVIDEKRRDWDGSKTLECNFRAIFRGAIHFCAFLSPAG